MKKSLLLTLLLTLFFFTGCADSHEVKQPAENAVTKNSTQVIKNSAQEKEAITTKIKITVNSETFDATLDNNPSADAFIKKMPLEVTMTELNGNEKYYRFNENFPSADEHVGKISTGDLMLYDSSYVVLFYKNFSTSYSYTRLGRVLNIDKLEKTLGGGNVKVKFEKY